MSENNLPFLKTPRDRMSAQGAFEHLAYDAKMVHPIEAVQKRFPQTEFQAKVANRARVFGPASAMHLHMDRALLSCKQRLPGLTSRRVGLETVLGKDDSISFEDYLGTPELAMGNDHRSAHDVINASFFNE